LSSWPLPAGHRPPLTATAVGERERLRSQYRVHAGCWPFSARSAHRLKARGIT